VLSEPFKCAVAADVPVLGSSEMTGTIRVHPFPPFADENYSTHVHTTAITDMAIETKGSLVATGDTAGIIMVHVLIPARKAPQGELVCVMGIRICYVLI
jgi:hypothetical protein